MLVVISNGAEAAACGSTGSLEDKGIICFYRQDEGEIPLNPPVLPLSVNVPGTKVKPLKKKNKLCLGLLLSAQSSMGIF